MLVYVLSALAAVVGLAGGPSLWRRSRFWSLGLLAGGLAAAAYAGGMAGSAIAFKVYYALGASMFPGLIGTGSLYAIFSGRLARWPAAFVVLLSFLQLGLTLPASVNGLALSGLDGGNGAGVLVLGPWVIATVLFNTFGLGFALVAALYGWWKAFRQPALSHAALAVGLSVVVLGVLARSDGVYQLLVRAGGGSAFLLLDAAAFALVWLGASMVRRLPLPLERLLAGGVRQSSAA
ncbi:MAG: hypothetical protein KGJ86_13810 [Chloroflexota bacterium]|nr:hypothetical protein [Chloroflexota bacterium]